MTIDTHKRVRFVGSIKAEMIADVLMVIECVVSVTYGMVALCQGSFNIDAVLSGKLIGIDQGGKGDLFEVSAKGRSFFKCANLDVAR